MYSGITDFRLKQFYADNTLLANVNFGEINSEDLVSLKELSDKRSVGIILCSVEQLEIMRTLLKQVNDLNEN